MSKKDDYINNSIQPIQTATKTLTAIPKAIPASRNAFVSILSESESKLKILINDFAKGKGENAVKVYFNLELKDVYYLYRCACNFDIPRPFSQTKIFGEPMKSGKYIGLSPVTKININRTVISKDTGEKGWNISIDNGYGKKMDNKNGGSYAKGGSIVIDKKSYMQITDQNFLMIFQDAFDYFQIKKNLFASQYLALNEDQFKQMMENNYYNTSSSIQTKEEVTTDNNVTAEPNNVIEFQNKGSEYKIVVTSDFQKKNNQNYFMATIDGKAIEIYFPKGVSFSKEDGEILKESKKSGIEIKVNLSVSNNTCYLREIKKTSENKTNQSLKEYEVFIRTDFVYNEEKNASFCKAMTKGREFYILFPKMKTYDIPDELVKAKAKGTAIKVILSVVGKTCYFKKLA